jgi:hypothetical protein
MIDGDLCLKIFRKFTGNLACEPVLSPFRLEKPP